MLDKIKALPHRNTFIIGMILMLIGFSFNFNFWTNIIGYILSFIGIILISIAADKKHSNIDK